MSGVARSPFNDPSYNSHNGGHNEYDYDYDFDDQPSYPPPQVQYNSAYGIDHKSQPPPPPLDNYTSRSSEPTYPPTRPTIPASNPFEFAAPSFRPSLSTSMSTHEHSIKPYASTVDFDEMGELDNRAVPPLDPDIDVTPSRDYEEGWRAAIWPNSRPCRYYILAVLVETVIDIVIEGAILEQLDKMEDTVPQSDTATATKQTRQPVYLGIFVLAHLLQLTLAVDAVYNKNTLQFLFLAVFNASLILYGGLQIIEVQDNINQLVGSGATLGSVPIKALLVLVPIVVAIAEVAYVMLGYQIWKEFGWKVYKFLGADRTIKKVYANYQVFQCLLKFDIFFWVGFSVQFISLVLVNRADFEFYATIVALPISLLLLIEGYLASRHERRWMMISFMVGCVLGMVYFVYKCWRIIQERKTDEFVNVWKSLLIFACLSVVLLVTTAIQAMVVMFNFDKGLKTSLNRRAQETKLGRRMTLKGGLPTGGLTGYPEHVLSKRMSIE